MQTTIDEAIKRDEKWHRGVLQANTILEDEMGRIANRTRAEWVVERDEMGRPGLRLNLSDPYGVVLDRFAPAELGNDEQLRARLHRLSGQLLRSTSHELLRRIKELLEQQEGNGSAG